MEKFISQELVDATQDIRKSMNLQIQILDGPEIGSADDEIGRAEAYVAFNDWLKEADMINIRKIVSDYGLLPMVFSLSGIDVADVMAIQQTARIDLSGHVRYIGIALGSMIGTEAEDILRVGTDFFGDSFNGDQSVDAMRSQFISKVLGYFVNTSNDITYEQAMARYLELIQAE